MKQILFVDAEKHTEQNKVFAKLAMKLEFMSRHENSNDEEINEKIAHTCTPSILYGLIQEMREIDKIQIIGKINL